MSSQSEQVTQADAATMEPVAPSSTLQSSWHTHNTAPTRFVDAGGIRFAYRRFGNQIGTPIVLLQLFMGNLYNDR